MNHSPELIALIDSHCRNCILRITSLSDIHSSSTPDVCVTCIDFVLKQVALREARERLHPPFIYNP